MTFGCGKTAVRDDGERWSPNEEATFKPGSTPHGAESPYVYEPYVTYRMAFGASL